MKAIFYCVGLVMIVQVSVYAFNYVLFSFVSFVPVGGVGLSYIAVTLTI